MEYTDPQIHKYQKVLNPNITFFMFLSGAPEMKRNLRKREIKVDQIGDCNTGPRGLEWFGAQS